MRNPIAAPRTIPDEPWACDIVSIDTPIVPYILTALYWRVQKFLWDTPEAARLARHALAKQGAELLMGCKAELIFEHRRLYRLLDTALLGHIYTDTGTLDLDGLPVVTPAVPNVPLTPAIAPSLTAYARRADNLLSNLINGTTNADAVDARNIRDQLDEIIAALAESDSLDPEMLAKLTQIAALLA